MAYELKPQRRSRLGPVFSLMPDFEHRRVQFDARFEPVGDGWHFTHKRKTYVLTRQDYVAASKRFVQAIDTVKAEWRSNTRYLIAGSVIGAFVYFGFVDALIAMLPSRLESAVNAVLIFQPIFWACLLAYRQERQIKRIYDGIARHSAPRITDCLDGNSKMRSFNWGSILVQIVALLAIAAVFGRPLIDMMLIG